MGNPHDLGIGEAYSCRTVDELKQFYDGSAPNYDSFVLDNGYVLPRKVALKASLSLSGGPRSVLDVGCGTGLLGQEIRALKPWKITGVDISAEMLNIAEHRCSKHGIRCYEEVIMADMSKRHPFMRDSFDVIVSSGTFTPGHLGPEDLLAMLFYLKDHGSVFVSVNSEHFMDTYFERKLINAHNEGKITKPSFVETAAWHNPEYNARAVIASFSKA
jgi:predicted TPR repeat methyltransferase